MVFQREFIYTLGLGLAPVLSSEHQVLQLLSRREGMSKTTYTNTILVLGLFILKTGWLKKRELQGMDIYFALL